MYYTIAMMIRKWMTFLLLFTFTFAQLPTRPKILWQKIFLKERIEKFYTIAVLDNENCIVSAKSHDRGKLVLLKIDDKGNLLWQKKLPRFSYVQSPKLTQIAPDTFIIAATGYDMSFHERLFLAKFQASDGKILWIKQMPYDGYSHFVAAIAPTSNGRFVLINYTLYMSGNRPDVTVRLEWFDTQGRLWNKRVIKETLDRIYRLKNGEFIAIGGIRITSETPLRLLLMRFDTNRKVIWKKCFKGIPYAGDNNVAVTKAGRVGIIYQTDPQTDRHQIALFDENGSKIMHRSFQAPLTLFKAITESNNGGFVVAGERYDHNIAGIGIVTILLDKNGKILNRSIFNKTYYGDPIQSIAVTPKGNLLIAGSVVKGNHFYGQLICVTLSPTADVTEH